MDIECSECGDPAVCICDDCQEPMCERDIRQAKDGRQLCFGCLDHQEWKRQCLMTQAEKDEREERFRLALCTLLEINPDTGERLQKEVRK